MIDILAELEEMAYKIYDENIGDVNFNNFIEPFLVGGGNI